MKRVIAFGCSFAYGATLPDCFEDKHKSGPVASKRAYPQLIGESLGLETINLARPGSSPIRVLYNILNFNFSADDLVLVQWPFSDRDALFTNKDTLLDVGLWVSSETVKNYYLVHDSNDRQIKTTLHIHHAHLYLQNKGIKTLHILNQHDPGHQIVINDNRFKELVYYSANFIETIDKGLDNLHPGIMSHQNIAKDIKEILNEQDRPKQIRRFRPNRMQ